MSYHGEIAWFPAGLVEIAVMMTVVAVNNEGNLWRNFCIVVLQQGVGSLFLQWRHFHFQNCRSIR